MLDNCSYLCCHLSTLQAVWIQIRTDILLVLIWIQNVCKGYPNMAKVVTSNKRVKLSLISALWKYHARLVRPGPLHSGQVENFYLLFLGRVQMY